MRLWAGVYIGWLATCAVVLAVWTAPAASRQLGAQQASIAYTVALVGGLIGLAIACVYPIVVLVLLGKPEIVVAFEGNPR